MLSTRTPDGLTAPTPPSSSAPQVAAKARARAASARRAVRWNFANSSMGSHPLRHRFGLLVPEVGIGPQESEESEINHGQRAAEEVLDERQVRVRSEDFRNPFGRLARTDRTEQHERDGEDAERDLVATAAVAHRLDQA